MPEPFSILEEAKGTLRRWAEVAEAAWQADEDIASALDAAFGDQLDDVDPVHREKLETLNGIHSNAAGFKRWLETRGGHHHGHTHNHPHSHSPVGDGAGAEAAAGDEVTSIDRGDEGQDEG